ncbi:unnamed protein product [Clonostachys rosea f. rosea IK726]|uniref:MYND-type domain-containing protein n=2 Tax=Bionectria ochroleuca TaxID=29856 RepID=A0A0B7K3U7_BIOOC|nr:unnamed protein product [Clonostachys rosea f. rosea IK726]
MASGAGIRRGPVGPLIHRCRLSRCQATGPRLQRCTRCKAVRYCGPGHQLADRDSHTQTCRQLVKARARLDIEHYLICKAGTPNAFETSVGYFWEIKSTRPYMRVRLALAKEILLPLGTLDSVQEAHDHLRDMLRLCRMDTMAVRYILPCIMLRLDMDQECYDFVKWWMTRGKNGGWGDLTLPYLDIHGADAFEQPQFLLGEDTSLSYVVAVLVLKLKLLVDVLDTKVTRKVLARRSLPNELRARIEQTVARSPLSAHLYRQSYKTLSTIEQRLLTQVRKLGINITETNQYFMPDLFDPDKALTATAGTFCEDSIGLVNESDGAIQHSYVTWWSTEGVLGLLDSARDCAARASKPVVEDTMASETYRENLGSHVTAEELQAKHGLRCLWRYLDYAVRDATYLGPWADRPSEVTVRGMAERHLALNGGSRFGMGRSR